MRLIISKRLFIKDTIGIMISFQYKKHGWRRYLPIFQHYKLSTDHIVLRIRHFTSKLATPEFPATCCFHHIVVVMIPESNVACMRLMCAMRTLHTLKLEFVKRFWTYSVTVKFWTQMFHTLSRCYILITFFFPKRNKHIRLVLNKRFSLHTRKYF